MTPAEKEPFVVIWSPKNRNEQPELYDTMHHLAEPETVEVIKNIARKYGVPGFEFQLYEIDQINSDLDGKLGVRFCYDTEMFQAVSNFPSQLYKEISSLIELDSTLAEGNYHESGKFRDYHDKYHVKQFGLEKIFDSHPELYVVRGA